MQLRRQASRRWLWRQRSQVVLALHSGQRLPFKEESALVLKLGGRERREKTKKTKSEVGRLVVRCLLSFIFDFLLEAPFPSQTEREKQYSHGTTTTMPPIVLHSRGGSVDPQALKAIVAAAAAGVAIEVRRLPSSSPSSSEKESSKSSLRLELESSGVSLTQPNAIARFLGKIRLDLKREEEREREKKRDEAWYPRSPLHQTVEKTSTSTLTSTFSRPRPGPCHLPRAAPRKLARVGGDHAAPRRRGGLAREGQGRGRSARLVSGAGPPRGSCLPRRRRFAVAR